MQTPSYANSGTETSNNCMGKQIYTDQLGEVICKRMIMGESIAKITKDPDMPCEKTIYNWAWDKNHPFAELYKRAREMQAERYIDEIIDIADDKSDDYTIVDGVKLVNHENIQRARLKVDTRKWVACKVLPKIYGDKASVDVTTDGKPLESLTDEERFARMLTILEQARKRRAGQTPEGEPDL